VIAFYLLLCPAVARVFIFSSTFMDIDTILICFFVSTMGLVMAHFRLNERIVKRKMIKLFNKTSEIIRRGSISRHGSERMSITEMDAFFSSVMKDFVAAVFSSLYLNFFYDSRRNLQSWSDEYEHKRVMTNADFLALDPNFSYFQRYKIQLTEYAPMVFESIRDQDRLSHEVLMYALNPEHNLHRKSTAEGGSSGAFLFFTHDQRFLLKTVDADEITLLKSSFLKKLHKHIQKNQENSLLARIYGLFKFTMTGREPSYFIILQNVFDIPPTITFDLKGSQVNRQTTRAESLEELIPGKVYKDDDFLRIVEAVAILNKTYIMSLVVRDVHFL
jgi:hypothetical protein